MQRIDKCIFKALTMGNLIYIIAIILVVFWATGFFIYNVDAPIHFLLVFAVITLILGSIKEDQSP